MYFTWIASSTRLCILVLGFIFLMMPALLAVKFTQYYFYDELEGKEIWYYAGLSERNYSQIPGASLVVPTSVQQQEFIYTGGVLNVVDGISDHMFIGVTDEEVEDNWRDENGEQITYTAWESSEPGGGQAQNCAIMKKENTIGTDYRCWHDYYCYRNRGFACQTTIWTNGVNFADIQIRSDRYQCSSTACLMSGQSATSGSMNFCASACTSRQRCGAFQYDTANGSCLLSGDESSIETSPQDVENVKCCFRIN